MQTTELHTDLMSFVSKLNASFTDDVNLITPEIHVLLDRLVHADIDRINFTSFEVLVSLAVSQLRYTIVDLMLHHHRYFTLCSEKNTHSQFLSYLHERCVECVDLNKNCSEYT